MKRSQLLLTVLVLAMAAFLIGCPGEPGPNHLHYKRKRQRNTSGHDNPVTVTVTQGSNAYSASVNLSDPGAFEAQSVSYTIFRGVPAVPRQKLFPLSSPTCQNSVASSAREVFPTCGHGYGAEGKERERPHALPGFRTPTPQNQTR